MAGKTLIKNGTVVTMNDAGDVHFGGSVLLDGDRIADVGAADEVASRHADDGQVTVIDAAGKAVLPGLVDLHYHTALGMPFQLASASAVTREKGTVTPLRVVVMLIE